MKHLNFTQVANIFKIIIFFVFLFSVRSRVLALETLGGTEDDLFTEVDIHGEEIPDEPTIARARFVNVNFELLGDSEMPANKIRLNLFDDAVFTAVIDHAEEDALGSSVWVGKLEGIALSQVVLVKSNGILSGSVSMPEAVYQILYAKNDIYIIEDIDQSFYPPELEPIEVDTELDGASDDVNAMTDSCTDITILVAYSPEARSAAGGTSAIEALISQAVAETNQSYANSGLVQRLTLVHTIETTAGDASNNFSSDLYALRNLSDGIFDNVDSARETYYADEVALIIENGSSCGIAYLNASASLAFSVTHRTCATGYYSFGHELGHNMGAHHDWYVNGENNYNKGFVNLPDSWRTIMAYNSLCSNAGKYCTRLQYWSNPNINYNGDPMGVASNGPKNCVQGSTSPDPSSCAADNHSVLNNSCSRVANFRVSPLSEPQNFRVTGSGQYSISLAWDDTSSETGYKIYRKDGENFVYLDSVNANITAYTDENVGCNATYEYKLSAYNTGGESSLTDAVTGSTSSTCPAVPSNDDFDHPIDLSLPSTTPVLDTREATQAIDDPEVSACGIGKGYATLWYTYSSATNSAISIDTKTADYDTFIAVWTGSRGHLSSVVCNDDAGTTKQSAVAFSVVAGETYYIEIGQP